jgi:hypothetical protein
MMECCLTPYSLGQGYRGDTGENGADGNDGNDAVAPVTHTMLYSDVTPIASTDLVDFGDPRLYKIGNGPVVHYNDVDFVSKNFTIPAGTLANDGDMLVLKVEFEKNDTPGTWLPSVRFNQERIDYKLFDIYPPYTRPYMSPAGQLGGVSLYSIEIRISRTSNNKITVISRSRNMNNSGTISPIEDNPRDKASVGWVNLDKHFFRKSSVINLDLNLVDYLIDYEVYGVLSGGTGTRPFYFRSMSVEKIGVLV